MFKNKLYLYIKLMRLNSPIGIFLLLWPPFWVIAVTSNGNIYNLISFIFLVGIITSRTIGCVINDFFDKKFDSRVSRTKDRPYASNLISKKEIFFIFVILSFINLSLLLFLNMKTVFLAFIAIIFIIIYPLTKRFIKAPQVFLGLTFSISTLMAFTSITNQIPDYTTWIFFIATLVWVTMFDTMYAMSDKEDDLKININSTAILFGNRDREITGFLQCVFFGIFIYIGYLKEYSYIFYLFLLLAIVLGVYNQMLISKRNREFCIMAFKNNQYIGMLIFFGIYGEYLI